MAREALGVVAAIPELGKGLEQPLAAYAQSPDDEIRGLALKAGAKPGNLWQAIRREKDIKLRCLLLRQTVRQNKFDPVPVLLEHLGDPDWRIRSAAAEPLVELGPGTADRLRPC